MKRQSLPSLARSLAGRLLPLVPHRIRTTVLRSRVLMPLRRWFLADNSAHWDQWYKAADIGAIESNARERRKFALTLDAVGDGPIGRALEVGCGPGIFSSMLAARSGAFVGVDLSPVAVAQANERLASMPDAHATVGSLPDRLPDGPFDVIVASDVLYYLSESELQRSLERIESLLAPAGVFVAVHHRHDIGVTWSGDALHRQLRQRMVMRHEAEGSDAEIAVDRYRRPARQPVADEQRQRPQARRTVGAIILGLTAAGQAAMEQAPALLA